MDFITAGAIRPKNWFAVSALRRGAPFPQPLISRASAYAQKLAAILVCWTVRSRISVGIVLGKDRAILSFDSSDEGHWRAPT
jgi:hypothetical protein